MCSRSVELGIAGGTTSLHTVSRGEASEQSSWSGLLDRSWLEVLVFLIASFRLRRDSLLLLLCLGRKSAGPFDLVKMSS